MKKNRKIILSLVIICLSIMFYKITVLGFHPSMVIPITNYRVDLEMQYDGHGNDIRIKTYLPDSTIHQKITDVSIKSGPLNYELKKESLNSRAIWQGNNIKGRHKLQASFNVNAKKMVYDIPKYLPVKSSYNKIYQEDLKETELIQKSAPQIVTLAKELKITNDSNVISIIGKAYKFASDSIKPAKYSARTSALLALQLHEASCNGKSRLMVALLRNKNIPSRLVGGIILKDQKKRVTHQWLEVKIGNQWVPFDPLNRHFAELPENYLELYRGDKPMFTRSSNINFKYLYEIDISKKAPVINTFKGKQSWLNILKLWDIFKNAGISTELLNVLLMIPLGAVVIIIFRNVIGVHTFGTFLPVLIAVSFGGTGLLWGHIVFISVIIIGIFVRQFLERLQLLHSPKLTIILVSVIVSLILMTIIGIKTGNKNLLSASMFPLAIISITIERFCTVIEANGLKKAITIFLWTLLVVTFCYISMLSVFLQTIVMVFPETLLIVVAMSLYLGSWNHLRLSEFLRFRKLIMETEV